MSIPLLDNPIAWAHFKVRGGWRNNLWTTGGYVLLITAAICISAKFNPVPAMLSGWTTGLLGLQLAIPLFLGCGMVNNAIRRDITSGLLESHRLMPVSSAAAVLGYLSGAPFQVLCIGGATFLIGTATASLGGVRMESWLAANAIVALFVLFLWVVVAFSSFIAKSAFSMLIGLIVPAMMSGGKVIEILPGLSVLVTPIAGGSIFMMVARGSRMPPGFVWAFAAQLVFAAIFFRGAMRRYRRDDVPAFGVVLGMLLLAAWVATSAIGIVRWLDFQHVWMGPRRSPQADPTLQIIATLLTSMLIGIVPVGAAARASVEWMGTFLLTGRRPARRPLPPPLIACLATCLTLQALTLAPPRYVANTEAAISVGLVLLSFYLAVSYLLRIYYRAGRRPAVLLGVWVALTWLIPLGIDALRSSVTDAKPQAVFALASPWGSLIDLWSDEPTHSYWGIAFQMLLAILLGALFHSSKPKFRPQPADLPVQ